MSSEINDYLAQLNNLFKTPAKKETSLKPEDVFKPEFLSSPTKKQEPTFSLPPTLDVKKQLSGTEQANSLVARANKEGNNFIVMSDEEYQMLCSDFGVPELKRYKGKEIIKM